MEYLLGHLLGDFMFQGKNMAITKSKSTWTCFYHVCIYTLCVCMMTGWWTMALWIAVPHFLIDRWSLAGKIPWTRLWSNIGSHGHPEIDKVFTAIVYTVNDQTMHLMCLYGVYLYVG